MEEREGDKERREGERGRVGERGAGKKKKEKEGRTVRQQDS